MTLKETINGVQYFIIEHSKDYQNVQFQFYEAVESLNPQNIAVCKIVIGKSLVNINIGWSQSILEFNTLKSTRSGNLSHPRYLIICNLCTSYALVAQGVNGIEKDKQWSKKHYT